MNLTLLQNEQSNIVATFDIFLSYHWCYHTEIINLHRILTKQGFKVWLDLVEIKIGDHLEERVKNAIRLSTVFIGFYCDSYVQCKNCELELSYAIMEQKNIFILSLNSTGKHEEKLNAAKHGNLHVHKPEAIVSSFKPTNTTNSPSSYKFSQYVSTKTKINIDITASDISKFLESHIKRESVSRLF